MCHSLTRRLWWGVLLLAGVMGLSGCAPLIVGGTAMTSAVIVSDRRTAGEQLEDQVIELKIASEIRNLALQNARVNAMSYAGVTLLTGDVASPADSRRVVQVVEKVEKVQRVVDRLRIGAVTPFSVRNNDVWLTSKTRTALLNAAGVPSRTIVITTERGVVYLMGRVTRTEADLATRAVAQVNGIHQVVSLFEVITPERVSALEGSLDPQAAPQDTPTPVPPEPEPVPPATDAVNVQVMPVQ